MAIKKKVAILFGGKSAEHDISILSAHNVLTYIDKSLYDLTLIGIDKTGKWLLHRDGNANPYQSDGKTLSLEGFEREIMLTLDGTGRFYELATHSFIDIDIVHPVLHGPFGEDGAIQGLFETAHIAYVGPDVLGSSVGMDKEIMKRILRDNGINVGPFLTARSDDVVPDFAEVDAVLSMPVYVKPANMGSSIGISKVRNKKEYLVALKEAFIYDSKVIIEANIEGREIECGVLGNSSPKSSLPGEVILNVDFYAFDTKYVDEGAAELQIPANLSPSTIQDVQDVAIKTFKVLGCEGLSRVDFFIKSDNTIYVNEINTLPGFTSISMYPAMWMKSGLTYPELLNELYRLAEERFERR